MASKEIPDLPDAAAPTGTEWFHVVQGGNSRRLTLAGLIALIVDGSPVTLDTLNELAAALGDDPNFSVTILNALADKAPKLLTIENVAGAAYTFASADVQKHKRFTNAGAVVATIPLNASDPIPIGARIRITDKSGSGVTLALEDPAIVVNSRDDAMASAGLNAVFEIEKVATNEWDVLGDVA